MILVHNRRSGMNRPHPKFGGEIYFKFQHRPDSHLISSCHFFQKLSQKRSRQERPVVLHSCSQRRCLVNTRVWWSLLPTRSSWWEAHSGLSIVMNSRACCCRAKFAPGHRCVMIRTIPWNESTQMSLETQLNNQNLVEEKYNRWLCLHKVKFQHSQLGPLSFNRFHQFPWTRPGKNSRLLE